MKPPNIVVSLKPLIQIWSLRGQAHCQSRLPCQTCACSPARLHCHLVQRLLSISSLSVYLQQPYCYLAPTTLLSAFTQAQQFFEFFLSHLLHLTHRLHFSPLYRLAFSYAYCHFWANAHRFLSSLWHNIDLSDTAEWKRMVLTRYMGRGMEGCKYIWVHLYCKFSFLNHLLVSSLDVNKNPVSEWFACNRIDEIYNPLSWQAS